MKESPHFHVQELAQGMFACVHKSGGGAYSNAGIVDLGDQTLVIDAFDSMAAGRDLRQTAEELLAIIKDLNSIIQMQLKAVAAANHLVFNS